MRYLILFSLSLHFTFKLSAQATELEIVQKSYAYYKDLSKSSFTVVTKLKSPINTDFLISNDQAFFQRTAETKMMKLVFEDGNFNLYDDETTYFVTPANTEIFYDKSKHNKSNERLKPFPQWMPQRFFEEVSKKIAKKKSDVKSSVNADGLITISFNEKETISVFRFDSMFRIANYSETIETPYGTQVKEYHFKEKIGPFFNYSLLDELNALKREYQHISDYKRNDDDNRDLLGVIINIDSLKRELRLGDSISNYIYLDFFHKSCLPCIESIPDIIRLKNSFEPKTLRIFAIDPIKQDQGDWSNFKARYKINYSVIDGDNAIKIVNIVLKDRHFGYPISMVISKEGKIEVIKEGYFKSTIPKMIDFISNSMKAGKEHK